MNTSITADIGREYEKINRLFGKAMADYKMINEGDKVMVAVSGGKDSLCLLHFMLELQKKAPISFEILAVNVDQGQPGFPKETLPNLFERWEVPYHVEYQDTYSVVLDKTKPGKSYCSICSRMRRGILYRLAEEHGCNKVALGHHRDDVLETFLMNAFFSGQLAGMPANYKVEAGHCHVIRPFYSVPEELIASFVAQQDWPIIPCSLCGSQEGLKRQELKGLLADLQSKYPELKGTLFGALHHPDPRFLYDQSLWENELPEIAKKV